MSEVYDEEIKRVEITPSGQAYFETPNLTLWQIAKVAWLRIQKFATGNHDWKAIVLVVDKAEQFHLICRCERHRHERRYHWNERKQRWAVGAIPFAQPKRPSA